MSDLERPLLSGDASEAAVGAAGVSGRWRWSRGAGANSEPAPVDASAWLQAEAVACRSGGPASAAVVNLSNTIVGAGIMALPKVFKVLGILPASLLLLTVYALTHLSLNLLLRGTVVCGRMSFREVVASSLGRPGVLTMQLAVIVNNLGGLVVFLIIVGDVLAGRGDEPGLLQPLGCVSSQDPALPRWSDALASAPWDVRPVAVAFVVALLHTPLCLQRRVDSLKFTSALSMCLSFVFISITLSLVADRLATGYIGPINWLPAHDVTAGDVLKTLPVVMTAYVCHYNIHPIFAEMAAPSEPRMRRVVTTALLLCTAVYWLVGLSAYLLFTDRTADDVLMNYGRDLDVARGEVWIERAVKIGYATSLSCTFPLIQFALRQNLFDLAGWGDAAQAPRRFTAVTCALLAVEYLLAMLVPNISVAFSVLGSTVAVLIGFVLPALIAIHGTQLRGWGRMLLVVGVVFGASSFSATVYGLVAPTA